MSPKELFSDRTFYRRLGILAFPITLQSLMLALVAAGDAVMLGRVNQESMAAVSLATQIQFIQNMVLWSIVSGIGILGAQYWGKGDKATLGDVFGISIRSCTIISVVFFLLCLFTPRPLMCLFASDEPLIQIGIDYLKIAAWSYLLTGVSQCYLAVMKVSDHAGWAATISSVTVILNILLNAVFIFGLFGVPAMEARGAALATVIARILELGWCMLLSYRNSFIRLEVARIFKFCKELTLDFYRCAIPILGAGMLWGIGFTTYTAIMGHLGSDSAAANSIAAVMRDLICCMCNGIASAGGIIIGNELGAGRLQQGKIYGTKLMILSFITGVISTILILSSLPIALHYMKLTEMARHYMIGMFAITSFYMIGRCVCTVTINGIFSSGGDTTFDLYSLCVCMWGIALPCAFIGAFWLHLPVLVVFGCTCLDEVGKVPWVVHHFYKYKWVKNLTR